MEQDATGYENIKIAGILMGRNGEEIESSIPDLRQFTELGDFLDLPIRTYSTGMRARLAFGIATSFISDILVIDEFINAGDAFFFKKAQKRIENIVAKSEIMFLATHSELTIREFCNKAILLNQGCVKKFGNIEEVLELYNEQ